MRDSLNRAYPGGGAPPPPPPPPTPEARAGPTPPSPLGGGGANPSCLTADSVIPHRSERSTHCERGQSGIGWHGVAWREGTEWHRIAWVAWREGTEWHRMAWVAWHGIGLNYTYKEILNAIKPKVAVSIYLYILFTFLFLIFIYILLKMYLFFVTNTNYVCGVDPHCPAFHVISDISLKISLIICIN